jgi:hypothetical protein
VNREKSEYSLKRRVLGSLAAVNTFTTNRQAPGIYKDMNETKNRILKGCEYFEGIKPSQFNAGHVLHLKTFTKLIRTYLNGEPEEKPIEVIAEEIFKTGGGI